MADRERITRTLAAIASTPLGFVVGAFAGARLAATTEGVALLGWGLAGAGLFVAAILASARVLTGRRLLVVALGLGASSFALLAFMVEDYVAERIRAANAFDTHYATLPEFSLALHHIDPTRQPLSQFAFDATTLEFTAMRPGNWRCTGKANREEKAELHAALQTMPIASATACTTTAKWQIADAPAVESCDNETLIPLADAIIKAHERRTRCRKAP